MKRIFLSILLGILLAQGAGARCLVVTLANGVRMAFDLDEDVVMRSSDTQLTFNDVSINRKDIKEFRIFKERPADTIAVGIKELKSEGMRNGQGAGAVQDLGGRYVTTRPDVGRLSQLKPGIYIINHKKVVIR